MGANNSHAGLDVSQNSDDKIEICGMNPNINPSCVVDEFGYSRNEIELTSSQGPTAFPNSYPESKPIDNSGDHHGGSYSIIAMNKFTVDAAGGGINLNSGGNIMLFAAGGIANITSSQQVTVLSNVISLGATEVITIEGPACDINSEVLNCKNFAVFHSNALVNGSLAVNGELYVTHITGQQDIFQTQPYSPMTVFFDQGVKIDGTIMLEEISPQIQVIDAENAMAKRTVCRISNFVPSPLMLQTKSGYTEEHQHDFYHLAADLVEGRTNVWNEMKTAGLSEGAKIAKPASGMEKVNNKMSNNIVKSVTRVLSNSFSF